VVYGSLRLSQWHQHTWFICVGVAAQAKSDPASACYRACSSQTSCNHFSMWLGDLAGTKSMYGSSSTLRKRRQGEPQVVCKPAAQQSTWYLNCQRHKDL
jgi:hypothetical protein